MAYQVEISPSAIADIENIYLWLRDEFPTKADEWYNNLVETILSLEKSPNRCSLALESKDFDRELRQLIFLYVHVTLVCTWTTGSRVDRSVQCSCSNATDSCAHQTRGECPKRVFRTG